MSTLQIRPYVIVFLFMSGCWFLGQGFYIQAKALLAQHLLENAWLDSKQGGQQVKPWPWADTWPVARLHFPQQNIHLIVLAGDSGRTLAFGPGHNFATPEPGEKGHSLISGHRDTHFKFIQHLQINDLIITENAQGQLSRFIVESKHVVDRDKARFNNDENASYLHLVTCYPFDAIIPGGAQRYIVSAIALADYAGQTSAADSMVFKSF